MMQNNLSVRFVCLFLSIELAGFHICEINNEPFGGIQAFLLSLMYHVFVLKKPCETRHTF